MNSIISLIALAALVSIFTSTMAGKLQSQGLDAMVTDLKNQADALKAEIANSNLIIHSK